MAAPVSSPVGLMTVKDRVTPCLYLEIKGNWGTDVGIYAIPPFLKPCSTFFDADEIETRFPGIIGESHFHISYHNSVLLEFSSYHARAQI